MLINQSDHVSTCFFVGKKHKDKFKDEGAQMS